MHIPRSTTFPCSESLRSTDWKICWLISTWVDCSLETVFGSNQMNISKVYCFSFVEFLWYKFSFPWSCSETQWLFLWIFPLLPCGIFRIWKYMLVCQTSVFFCDKLNSIHFSLWFYLWCFLTCKHYGNRWDLVSKGKLKQYTNYCSSDIIEGAKIWKKMLNVN